MLMSKYYQAYHKHTSLSHRYNKDSSLIPMDYFKYMKSLADNSIPQIYSTVEHGWQGNYFKIYDDLEKFNKKNLEKNPNYKPIKFIFGTEAYWVENRLEKDSSNNHIVLLAKNDNGRKKINRAIYDSFKTGYYYKNRMDLEILLNLPKDDVFVTSACVAFWTSYIKNNDYNRIDEIILKLYNHFTDFYLEVQANNTDIQKRVNEHIIELHNKYNIPLIAGTDSHEIKMEQMTDRDDLLRSNGIHYDNEDGNYMDFPSYETLVQRFKEQGVLSVEDIEESIKNTNKILEFEDIKLDRSLKVPVAKKYRGLTQQQRNEVFEQILKDEWDRQYEDVNIDKFDGYAKEIQHDIKEIEDCNMADYFIDSYEIMKRGREEYGGVLTPSGRGSAVSMYLNKLLRLTKVDKVNSPVLMYSERFLTSSRVLESHTPPDIDSNCSDRQPFIQAQRDIIGEEGTFDLLALGTLHYKSAFKMYSRAYNLDPQLANEVTKQIDKYELAVKHADDDDKESIDIYSYVDKEKYGELIEGCQQYMGIVDNLKAHPCACLAMNGDAIEEVGVIMVKSESQGDKAKETFVAVLESGTIDAFGYLKQDYLIVDSIGLTYDIYKEIGIEPFSVNQLLKKIENNQKVWDVYSNGYTMCINQCEQTKSTEKVMRYKPKNISELTQFIAGIRPSFQSMYKIFESREHFDYGIKAFDDLIQDEYCDSSFILYQEHLMKVLGFAGFPMNETYTIIKAISKKKDYVIKGAKEKFIPNFAQAILETRETEDKAEALRLSELVWTIVENSASYGFNCVSKDTIIKRSGSNGKFSPTVEEMYNIMNDAEYAKRTNHYSLYEKYNRYGYGIALSMYDDKIVRENEIIDITPSGIRQTYKVITQCGSSIVCTDNHKFPTTNGEVELSKLKVGDKLYCLDNTKIYEGGMSTFLDEIISIEPYKIEQTYNIEMSDPNHNFISENGLITSNSAHAYCMAIDSVTLAYLKAYYPLEFYKVTLQRYTDKGDKDKVALLKKEMVKLGIKLNNIKFRKDNRKFSINYDDNSINQTMASIKNMQKIVPDILYKLGNKYLNYDNSLNTLMNIFKDILDTKINKSSIEILIRLNYFIDFGDINYIFYQLNIYKDTAEIIKKLYECKQLDKEYVKEIGLDSLEISKYCSKESPKQFREIDNAGLAEYVLNSYEVIINSVSKNYEYKPIEKVKEIAYQLAYSGCTDMIDSSVDYDLYIVSSLEINKYGTTFLTLYHVYDGEIQTIKADKKQYKENPCQEGDILRCAFRTQYKRVKEVSESGKEKWVEGTEIETILKVYVIETD